MTFREKFSKALLLKIILSAAVFLAAGGFATAILGLQIVNPTNTAWMTGDFVTMQFAWEAYRNDPLPASSLATNAVSWPLPIKIAMFDIVPLIAWPLKLISAYLPDKFQYFGLLFVLNAGLQGLFAFLFLQEMTAARSNGWEKTLSIVIAALFIAAAPVLYVRFLMGHPPLTAQWLIIAALWLYARSGKVSVADTILSYSALLGVASGINPYLLVMTTSIFCATILKLTIENRLDFISVAIAPAPLIIAIAALIFFGFLGIGGVSGGDGYGLLSSNANSLINPLPLLGSSLLPPLPIVSLYQKEGYGYLGLGAIFIILSGLAFGVVRKGLFDSFSTPLLFIVFTTFLLALSTTPSFGTAVFHVWIPQLLLKLLAIFRSSGRFIWVAHYGLLAVACALVLRLATPRSSLLIFAVAATLQCVDLAFPFSTLHAKLYELKSHRFDDAIYADLGRSHDFLIVLPPWQCGVSAESDYPVDSFEPVSLLAMDNHLKTNSFYSGRIPKDQSTYHCIELPRKFPHTHPDARTAYLFTPRSFLTSGKSVRATHLCDLGDDFVLCRADREHAGLSERLKRALGAATPFFPGELKLAPMLSHGFEKQDGALRMTAREANLEFASLMPDDITVELDITLKLEQMAMIAPPVDVYVNGVKVESIKTDAAEAKAQFTIPPGVQHFGLLIIAIADSAPVPRGLRLETIDLKPFSGGSKTKTTRIEFRNGLGHNPFLGEGWSTPEPWGVWSRNDHASLSFPRSLLGEEAADIEVQASGYLAPQQGVARQRILVTANGASLGDVLIDGSTESFTLKIPGNILRLDVEKLTLQFDFPNRQSPSSLGLSSDERDLALALKAVTIRRHP